MIFILLIFSILLDISIYKWRWLSDWICFIEPVYQFLELCIPHNDNSVNDLRQYQDYFIISLAFYTGSYSQIVFTTSMKVVFSSFLQQSLIYEQEMTPGQIGIKILYSAATFLSSCIFAMVLTCMSSLYLRMEKLNGENMKLLDGMHEGLLILSKSNY